MSNCGNYIPILAWDVGTSNETIYLLPIFLPGDFTFGFMRYLFPKLGDPILDRILTSLGELSLART